MTTSPRQFNNKELLKLVREEVINPLVEESGANKLKANQLENNLNRFQVDLTKWILKTGKAYTTTVVDGPAKELVVTDIDGTTNRISLAPMFDSILDETGVNIETDRLTSSPVKTLHFQGTGVGVTLDPRDSEKALITINQGGGGGGGGNPITATIHGQGSSEIDAINITGATPGTSIDGSQLNLHLPDGRFEGFAESMTELNKLSTASEVNQSFSYLKVTNPYGGKGWVPMIFSREPGQQASWKNFKHLSHLSFVGRNSEGILQNEGFISSIANNGVTDIANEILTVRDTRVEAFKKDATTDTKTSLGEIGQISFKGVNDSDVTSIAIPNDPHNRKELVINAGYSLKGDIDSMPTQPKNIKKISLMNAGSGSSISDDGTMTIDLVNIPTVQFKNDSGAWQHKQPYHNTQIYGNIGLSQSANDVLSLNIPYLKVGKKASEAFDQTHKSYAWKEPFDKWDDDLQWNPLRGGMQKKWEDDDLWADGKPWSMFSDTPVQDAGVLHFDGNVEVSSHSGLDKTTDIKIPFLKGQIETTGSESDVSKIVFPKGSTIQDKTLTIAPYPESVKTELDVEVDRRSGEGQITEAGVHKIHAVGKYARIDKEAATAGSVEKYVLGIDTHPYSQIKLGNNPFDAYFIQGSQEDFNHKTINIGDDSNTVYKDIVEVTGFGRFPKTFPGDGTPSFDIDGNLTETRFVFLKKAANSVEQDSPSKDVVAKGGWIMNLYTGNPTGSQASDNAFQVFYPLDGSDIKYRSGRPDSIGAIAWTDIGGSSSSRFKGFFANQSSLPTSGVVVNESYAYVFTTKKTDSDTADNRTPTMFRYTSNGSVNKWVEDAPKGTFVLDIDDKQIEDKLIESVRISGGGTGVKIEGTSTLVFDFDQLKINSAENFPEVFESTGTPDYDIDTPGKKSRYVFIKQGTQSDNILNYQYLDPEEKWIDFHRYNALSDASPSKDLVLKGGWVLNLYTDKDPSTTGSEEQFHQTFYPLDGSPPQYRANTYGSLATTEWVELGSSTDFKGFFDKDSDLPRKGNVDNKSYCYLLTKQMEGTRYRAIPQMYRWYNGSWHKDYVKGVLIASAGGFTNTPINEIKVTGNSKKVNLTGGVLNFGVNELIVEAASSTELAANYPAAVYKGTFGLITNPNLGGGVVIRVSDGKEWGGIAAKGQSFYKEKLGAEWTGEYLLSFRNDYPHRLCKIDKGDNTSGIVIPGDDGIYVHRFEEHTGFFWVKPDESGQAFGKPLTAVEPDGFYLHTMVQATNPEGSTWSETVAHTDAIWTQVLYGASSGRVWTRTKAKGVTARPVWSELESSTSKFERFPRIFPLTGTIDDGSTTVVNIEQPKRKSRFIYIPANTTPSGVSDLDWEEPDDDWDDDNLYNAVVAGAPGSEELLKKGGWVLCLYSGPTSGTDGAKISQVFYPQDGSAPKFRASDYGSLSNTPWKNFTGGSKDTGHIIGKVGDTDESEIQKIEFSSKLPTIIDGVLKVPALKAFNDSTELGEIGGLKAGSGLVFAKETNNNQETGNIILSLKDASVKGKLTVVGKDWDSSAIPSTSSSDINSETTKIEFAEEMDVNIVTEGDTGSQTTYVKVGLKNGGMVAKAAPESGSGNTPYQVIESIRVIGESTETTISDKRLEINVKPPVEISEDDSFSDFTTNYPPRSYKGRLALVEPLDGMYVSNGTNWSPISNFTGLTRKHYSVLIPHNDTQIDSVLGINKLNYQPVQDPEANIKVNNNMYQILQAGDYDISCMFQMSSDGTALRGKVFTIKLDLHTNESGTAHTSLTAEVTYDSTGKGEAKLFRFKNVALAPGVNFFIKPTITKKSGSNSSWSDVSELDPYKNFIVVEQASSLTETGLNIAKTLRDTLGGLSFKDDSEVRVVRKNGSSEQYIVKAEMYESDYAEVKLS